MRSWLLSGCALLAVLPVAGCGEVESCPRGEEGCVDGLAVEGECRFGLVEDPTTFVCVEPDDLESPVASCRCGANQACREDGSCVDLCAIPAPIVVPRARCRPLEGEPEYDYQAAATALCQQECARRAQLCGTPCDPAESCGPVLATAAAQAAGCLIGQVDCVVRQCEAARDRPCAEQACPGGAPPSCSEVTCTDTCGDSTLSYNFDGVCDDGDLASAVSAICEWGSDCGDCGPRFGPKPKAIRELGEQCIDPFHCGAPYDDFSDVPGWCVAFDETLEHCVPDCSVTGRCPGGMICQPLRFPGETGDEELVDLQDRTARACFPAQCGG